MALDEADIKKVSELIAAGLKDAMKPETLGAALAPIVTEHVKAATKDVPTGDALAKLIGDAVAKAKPADDPDKDKGGKKDEKDPAIAALTKTIEEMKAQSAAKDKALADEQAKARTSALHGAARDALAKAGIPADRLPHAMAYVTSLGVLDYDGDAPGWKGKSPIGLDAVLPMDDAAKAFVGSDAGKLYIPPSGAQGSGDGVPRNNVSRGPSAFRDADGKLDLGKLAAL
jgi:hypothetical protein